MYKYILALTLILVFPISAQAKKIDIDNGGISFNSPIGFHDLPKRIRDIKFPLSNAPKYIIGNKTGSTTIAYDIKPNKLSQTTLGYIRESFTKSLPNIIPGLKWKANKIINHSGQKWIYLEMSSTAIDTGIYNIMLITDYRGKTLMFNFNSTTEDFPRYERELRKSIASIKLR